MLVLHIVVHHLTRLQRALFLSQLPVGVLAGIGVYFSVPSFSVHASSKGKTTLQKLAGIDYLGAFMMVSPRSIAASGGRRKIGSV